MENATQTINVKEMLEKQLQLLSEQSQLGFGSGRDLAEVSRVILDRRKDMETKHLHGVTGFATQADIRAIEQRLDMLEKEIAELRSAIQGG